VGAFIYAWNNIDGFAEGVMSVLTAIGQGIEWMINAFITAVEFLINALIHSIMAPFWAIEGILNLLGVEITLVPTVSLPRVDFGFNQKAVSSVRKATGITAMATGGIVDSATLAVIGESGREAVLPLEGNMGWADAIAERITQDRQAFPTKITLVDADGSIIGRMKSQIRYNNLNLGLV
jgi:SLT domain-containing protein